MHLLQDAEFLTPPFHMRVTRSTELRGDWKPRSDWAKCSECLNLHVHFLGSGGTLWLHLYDVLAFSQKEA